MFAVLMLVGCPKPMIVPENAGEGPERGAPLDRDGFNQRAAERALPVFWISDAENPHTIDPGEAVWLWEGGAPVDLFVDGKPSSTLTELMAKGTEPVDARSVALRKELAGGRPTLVLTDVTAAERPFVTAMLEVAGVLEELHGLQKGTDRVRPAPDALSRAVFHRNQGPACESNRDPACHATVESVKVPFGLYPADMQMNPDFCAELEGGAGLMDPFTAVREGPVAIPYSEAWPEASKRANEALLKAAGLLPETEQPLASYLRAAADAFLTNDWFAADEAWLGTREKSAWYVRVGPDETYWEPCDRKAGYHMVFSRINPASVRWQSALEPHKMAMEQALAAKSGPYEARQVAFSLPEFIDIVVNAGDARNALGATIGQSLPNWGPVAEAGGRTVAMTNLNNDPDSLATKDARAASLFCSVDAYSSDPEPLLFSTLLHEAAHNLGPASGYRVNGKTDEEIFGGELATMLEELKAQTAALYLTDWLAEQGVVEEAFAEQAHLADLLWAFGKISAGMTDASGGALAYSQLSAIQVGLLIESGALVWDADKKAENGVDVGCFVVHLDALKPAIDGMADEVLGVKGRGDVEEARALKRRFVEEPDAALFATIAERWKRAPQNSFVYGFRFEE